MGGGVRRQGASCRACPNGEPGPVGAGYGRRKVIDMGGTGGGGRSSAGNVHYRVSRPRREAIWIPRNRFYKVLKLVLHNHIRESCCANIAPIAKTPY